MTSLSSMVLGCVVLATAFGTTAKADTIFSFDLDTPGTSTTFTDTVGSLAATFSSSGDPGGFQVGPSFYETLTGNVLADPGNFGFGNLDLIIDFSSNLSGVSLLFSTSDFGDPSPLTLTAFEGTKQVGATSAFGAFQNGFVFPEGSIAFHGAPFNSIVLATPAQFFAVDTIDATPTPEPTTLLLAGLGLIGLGLPYTRRKAGRR